MWSVERISKARIRESDRVRNSPLKYDQMRGKVNLFTRCVIENHSVCHNASHSVHRDHRECLSRWFPVHSAEAHGAQSEPDSQSCVVIIFSYGVYDFANKQRQEVFDARWI